MGYLFNGNFRILKWRYCTVPYKAMFWGYIPLHRPYIGLIYGRYLHFRILKFLLIFMGVKWNTTISGWWFQPYPSEKYEFVGLDHHPQSGWGK